MIHRRTIEVTDQLKHRQEEFAARAFDAIYKLQRGIRERDERIAELETALKAVSDIHSAGWGYGGSE